MTPDIQTENPILIDLPMPIRTDRLILRVPQAGDGAIVHAAKMESWGDLSQWMTWAKDLPSFEDEEARAREGAAKFMLREDIPIHAFTILPDGSEGNFVGGGGLHNFTWETRRFDIGYWVRTSEQGSGYAMEMANALTRYAFDVAGAKAVAIEHAESNDASQAVIEKLGFEKEGVTKMDASLPDGTQTNRHIYGITSSENLPALTMRWG